MHDNEALALCEQLAPFWAEVCGSGTEICVYDLSDPEHSLMTVCHPRPGHMPGSPLPQNLRELVDTGFPDGQSWLVADPPESPREDLRCHVCPIGDAAHPCGLLCVTRDLSAARELNNAMHTVLERFALEQPRKEEATDNELTLTTMMRQRISAVVTESGIPPTRMSVQEKVDVVHRLSETGVMNIKGAVGEIAAQLCVSVPTVYRYLNKHTHS